MRTLRIRTVDCMSYDYEMTEEQAVQIRSSIVEGDQNGWVVMYAADLSGPAFARRHIASVHILPAER